MASLSVGLLAAKFNRCRNLCGRSGVRRPGEAKTGEAEHEMVTLSDGHC